MKKNLLFGGKILDTDIVYEPSQFVNNARHVSISGAQVNKLLLPFSKVQSEVKVLCETSFLSDKCKRMYMRSYEGRMQSFLRKQ